jgi:hypothetical protein
VSSVLFYTKKITFCKTEGKKLNIVEKMSKSVANWVQIRASRFPETICRQGSLEFPGLSYALS